MWFVNAIILKPPTVIFLERAGGKFGISGVTGERLDHMEEDLRRLTQSVNTLNGMVAGIEDRLRTSLREDTQKILVSLLPNVPRVPDLIVGSENIPVRTPELDGDLVGRITEVKNNLQAKTAILEEIQVLYFYVCSMYRVQAFSPSSPSCLKS